MKKIQNTQKDLKVTSQGRINKFSNIMERTVKLNDETREILKNFSTINANLVVKPGSTISTMAETKTCLATATVTENFDK